MIPSTDVCSSALKYVGRINTTNHLTSSQCLSMKSLYVFNKGRHSEHLGNSQQCINLIKTEGLVLVPPSLPRSLAPSFPSFYLSRERYRGFSDRHVLSM